MKNTRTTLGAKLKQARQEAELKQEQVARYLQVTPSAISTMENGQRKVDATELFCLSKLYGKPMEWFFNEDHPLSVAQGVRWYDKDPLIREVIFLMEKSSPDLRRKAAYGRVYFFR